ncbi:MAG: hypothetical protein ACT4PW_11565 [Acidimicrobiia bacterium]
MGVLLFLAIPFGICALWLSVLALRQRSPSGVRHSIDDFRREMRALAPREHPPKG